MARTKTITVRAARAAAGLTIAELAEKSDVGWSAIHAIEGGRMPGGLDVRVRLSKALGVRFSELWPDTMAEIRAAIALDRPTRRKAKGKGRS